MKNFFVILLVILVLCLLFHFLTKKYLNPYKLIFCFGKKGCGKSTLVTKLAYQYTKQKKNVYCTEVLTLGDPKLDLYLHSLNPHSLELFPYEPGSVLLIDEASLFWDNRQFKSMRPETIEFFRLQRHKKLTIFLFSQTFDVDKKIRDLADEMYLINKYFRVFSVARRMIRKPVVIHPSPEAPARIDDDIKVDPIWLAPFGGAKFTYIPKWSKKFDSFK